MKAIYLIIAAMTLLVASPTAFASTGSRTLVDSTLIPLGDSATIGDPDAPIVIVEFISLQCPFCARGSETIEELRQRHPDEIQIVTRHFPLPFQAQSHDAARVAEAARRQGAFEPMREALLERQGELRNNGALELGIEIAGDLGLDLDRFRRDFNDPAIEARIEADLELGQSLGVRGTPHYFINGVSLNGAQPLASFESTVAEVLGFRTELLAAGIPEERVYAATVIGVFAQRQKEEVQLPTQPPPTPTPTPSQPTQAASPYVEIDSNDVEIGASGDYLVTVAMFCSLQCPFCARAFGTLTELADEYGGEVRFVLKHFPLDMHAHSEAASRALVAAQRQGRGRQMLQRIFEEQPRLGEDDLFEELALELGLNLRRFRYDFDSDYAADFVEESRQLGTSVGVRGTPHTIINGTRVSGAMPADSFRDTIDQELERARRMRRDRGLSGDDLYRALTD